MGLLPWPGNDGAMHIPRVSVIGINPPEEVTSIDSLIQGESSRGIGLWRRDLYGVGPDLAGKRIVRGWTPGMVHEVCPGGALDPVVEQLSSWDGGARNEWFPHMRQLPWYYGLPLR